MSNITKEEWQDWKQNNVTRAYMEVCDLRVQDAKDILSVSAGLDSDTDNFYRGFIAAYQEIKGVRVEDLDDV